MQLSYDTGALYALHEVLLANEIQYNERHHRKYGSRVVHHRDKAGTYEVHASAVIRILTVDRSRKRIERYGYYHCSLQIQRGVEGVHPLPHEAEQEYRDHHRNRARDYYPDKGLELRAAVNERRFFEFLGHTLEELAQHIDKQSVLKARAGRRLYQEWPVRIEQTDRRSVYRLEDTEDIEGGELHIQGGAEVRSA